MTVETTRTFRTVAGVNFVRTFGVSKAFCSGLISLLAAAIVLRRGFAV